MISVHDSDRTVESLDSVLLFLIQGFEEAHDSLALLSRHDRHLLAQTVFGEDFRVVPDNEVLTIKECQV